MAKQSIGRLMTKAAARAAISRATNTLIDTLLNAMSSGFQVSDEQQEPEPAKPKAKAKPKTRKSSSSVAKKNK